MSAAPQSFHLPLPGGLYDELRQAATEAEQPATEFAQDLMRVALAEWRKARRRAQIAAYTREVADSTEALDPEHAGIRPLVDDR